MLNEDIRWDARSGLLTTDRSLCARVLQYLVLDDEVVNPVDFYWYKGTLEVVP
jgi:hypothetical protein